MHCVRKISRDLYWVGVNNRRLYKFEGIYPVPKGVSYNSYVLLDEKNVLFDTVDKSVSDRFLENISEVLGERTLDYLVVQHMEPDHSATIKAVLHLYPEAKIVCNAKTETMLKQFFDMDFSSRLHLVKEGDILNTGQHNLTFLMAPMVHWIEVMVTYDTVDKILFSADAFGSFGALNGAIFADEIDFMRDYLDEARRYYTNIVGKYGSQVQTLLGKASTVDIDMICPLHGFVWRNNLSDFISKYQLWSRYEPENKGVMIIYGSVYGNTENAAEILATRLREKGVKTAMYDVSVTDIDEILAATFQWSHIVFASTTYNAGIFIKMEELVNDLVAHNFQNRTIAIIENGSWAAMSGDLIKKKLSKCANINILDDVISIKSSMKKNTTTEIETLVQNLCDSIQVKPILETPKEYNATINPSDLFKISYGLFLITTRKGDSDNGCIINTVSQVTENPLQISVTINKANYTHDLLTKYGEFNVSLLTEDTPFNLIKQFGYSSGKENDKFMGFTDIERSVNGIYYLTIHTNAVLSAKVLQIIDCGTHSIFIAKITETITISDKPSLTYRYYYDHIKPKLQIPADQKKGYICKVCGYIYEGENIPDDFICPLCKHGVKDFEKIG